MDGRKAWAGAVLTGWAATAIVVWLLAPADPTKSATLVILRAVLIAALPCVLVGGPVAAVALRFASRQDVRRARVGGWALGLGVLILISAAALAARWSIGSSAVLVVLVIEAAEVELALRLYCREGVSPTAW